MACKLNTPEWISLRVSPAGSLIKSQAFLYEGVLICIDKIETFDIDVGSFVHVGLDVLSRNPVSSKSITFWCFRFSVTDTCQDVSFVPVRVSPCSHALILLWILLQPFTHVTCEHGLFSGLKLLSKTSGDYISRKWLTPPSLQNP